MNFAMPLTKLDVQKGAYDRLGAQLEADGINFALFSGAAERVELCLFSEDGTTEIARVGLPEYTNEVWHGFVPGLSRGQLYGYRVHGRYAPEEGLRFNPNKLLLDPYARAHQGALKWDSSLYGYDVEAAEDKDLVMSLSDSAPFMPKSVVTDLRPAEVSTSIDALGSHVVLRNARRRFHQAASGYSAKPPWNFRRRRFRRDDQIHQEPGRHRG